MSQITGMVCHIMLKLHRIVCIDKEIQVCKVKILIRETLLPFINLALILFFTNTVYAKDTGPY